MDFVDTNLFVYAASAAPEDAAKRKIAHHLLSSLDLAISTQVMQEFADVALRKNRLGLTADEVDAIILQMTTYEVANITPQLVMEAIRLRREHQISYWDAAIVAAAQTLGCATLYSEDLNHGQNYEGVMVINPFKEDNI